MGKNDTSDRGGCNFIQGDFSGGGNEKKRGDILSQKEDAGRIEVYNSGR